MRSLSGVFTDVDIVEDEWQVDPGRSQVSTVEPEKKETNINSYALIGALALAVIGGGWYFKVYKPKHEDYDDDDEGMEYDDSDEESDD